VIGGEAADAGAGAGWHEQCGGDSGSETVNVFLIHGFNWIVPILSFDLRIASQSAGS
jgi:hypothetical protein